MMELKFNILFLKDGNLICPNEMLPANPQTHRISNYLIQLRNRFSPITDRPVHVDSSDQPKLTLGGTGKRPTIQVAP